jgi:hypothetical protein
MDVIGKNWNYNNQQKQTPWPLLRKRTTPTNRPPFVGEFSAKFAGKGVSRGQGNEYPRPLISGF